MPYIKREIDEMKALAQQLHSETAVLNNEKLNYDKEILTIQDEIKRFNYLNKELNNQKENIKNTIQLFKRHSELSKLKIVNQLKSTDELIGSLSVLAKTAQKNSG